MRLPIALALGLLLGGVAADAVAQDTWRGEQRLQRGGDRGGSERAAPRPEQRQAAADQTAPRASGSHWNNQQGGTYGDREQQRSQGGNTQSHPRYQQGGGQHDAYGYQTVRDDRRDNRGLPSNRDDWRRDRYQADHGRRDHGRPNDGYRGGGYQYGGRPNNWHNNWRHQEWRSHWYHGWSGSRYRPPVRYVYPHGYNYRRWNVGYRLPAPFLVSSYYIDYRPYGLAAPPYGCRWVRVDRDLLLVELVSGEIVDALYDFYY